MSCQGEGNESDILRVTVLLILSGTAHRFEGVLPVTGALGLCTCKLLLLSNRERELELKYWIAVRALAGR